MDETEPVSAHVADWTPEQRTMAATYGTCRICGAPRTSVTEERAPGEFWYVFACLNGHRGPYV